MSTTRRQGESILAFVIGCGLFLPFVRYGLNLEDEGALLAEFYRVYAGDVPVRDLHMGYTPGAYYLHAALFALFGATTTVARLALVVCHASVVALTFALGRRSMGLAFAVLPPLLYCAIMPFSPGRFASFNVPYPAWYTALFAVAGCFALVRYVESRRAGWLWIAGAAAGLSFSFKPNVGLFMLAGGALVLLLVAEPRRDGNARRRDVALWWAIALAVLPAIVLVFGAQAGARDLAIFVLPVAVIVVFLLARRLGGFGFVDRRDERLADAVLAYGGGTFVPVLPWAIWLFATLGPALFMRRVLFIGAGWERYYYAPFHAAAAPDAAVIVGAVGLAVAGLLVRARRLSPGVVAIAAVLGVGGVVVALSRAPMPQGFRLAVQSRAEDLSYTASLLVCWAGILALLRPLTQRARTADLRLFVVVTSALCSLLVVYPRSDFTHLVNAAPLIVLLGAVVAERIVRWFSVSALLARSLRASIVVGVLALAAVFVAPRVESVLEWNGGPAPRPRVWLDVPRAPIGLERGRAAGVRALAATVDYVRAHTGPGEAVFPFPAVELVCFLADRPNPTRFGYFFPGWPGHDVEAEVLATLRAAPPRLVVTLHEQQWYFRGAASYYYALREYVEREYRLVAHFGPYAVLARRDVPAPDLVAASSTWDFGDVSAALVARYGARLRGSPVERVAALRALAGERVAFAWPPLVTAFDDADPSVRRAAFDAITNDADADIAFAVAGALARGRIPRDRHEAALRLLQRCADARAIGPLLVFQRRVPDGQRALIDSILGIIADKVVAREYWLGSLLDVRAEHVPEIDPRLAAAVLADVDQNADRRRYLAWLAARGPDASNEELRIALEEVLWDRDQPEIVAAATSALMRSAADRDDEDVLAALLPLVGREPLFVPRLIVELHRQAPDLVALRVAAAMRGADGAALRELAWIAAACDDARFRDTFGELQSAPDRDVRMAALTGLAGLGEPDDWRRLDDGMRDPDVEVRALAARLIRTRTVR